MVICKKEKGLRQIPQKSRDGGCEDIIDFGHVTTATKDSEESFSISSGICSPCSIMLSMVILITSRIFSNASSLAYPQEAPPLSSRAGQ